MKLFENKTAQNLIDKCSYMEIIITEGCNMRCKYCFQHTKTNSLMSENTIDKVIQICKDNNIKEITLIGGEPISKFTLPRLEYIRDHYDGWLSITSNGYDFSPEIIDWYESVKNRCSVQISLDGLEEYHDINRIDVNGNGTFSTIINNVYKLSKIIGYKNINLRTVIVPNNIENLPQTLLMNKFLIDNKIIRTWSYGFDQSGAIRYNYDKFKSVLRNCFDMYDEGLININIIRNIFNEHELYTGCSPTACNLCKTMVFITPDGTGIDCHYSIGRKDNQNAYLFNINTGWVNPDIDNFVKIATNKENSSNSKGELCSECKAISVCKICRSASRYNTSNDNITPYNICLNNRALYDIFIEYIPDYGNPAYRVDELINELKTLDGNNTKRIREIYRYLDLIDSRSSKNHCNK